MEEWEKDMDRQLQLFLQRSSQNVQVNLTTSISAGVRLTLCQVAHPALYYPQNSHAQEIVTTLLPPCSKILMSVHKEWYACIGLTVPQILGSGESSSLSTVPCCSPLGPISCWFWSSFPGMEQDVFWARQAKQINQWWSLIKEHLFLYEFKWYTMSGCADVFQRWNSQSSKPKRQTAPGGKTLHVKQWLKLVATISRQRNQY